EGRQAIAQEGMDVRTCWRAQEPGEATFDVGGVLLARPFKVVRSGPVRLFVNGMAAPRRCCRGELRMTLTERVTWPGHRCCFLRVNTEHHSMALYAKALRAMLGLHEGTSLMAFGLQVASYRQLRDALPFRERAGVRIRKLPPELFPGIDYSAFAIDPD